MNPIRPLVFRGKNDLLRGFIALVAFAMAGCLLLLPLVKVYSLHSSLFDLGIFESLLYRIASTNTWQPAFASHAYGFALSYGWLYGAPPLGLAPYFLIDLQAILLVLPAFWFFHRFGVFAAFVYVTYCPVWINAYFDFHFDHLAVPLLLGFYWALLERRIGWAVLSATLLMFVKEPYALQTAACGVLLLWAAFHGESIWVQSQDQISPRKLVIGALWLIGAGISYFYFSMYYLLPYFSPEGWVGPLGGEAFVGLGHGLGEILLRIVTSPHVVVWEIINTPGKLIYMGVIFGLLAFIPLLRPIFLIPAMPLLAIAMLSNLPNHYDYNTHYTAGLIIPVMLAFVYGLPRVVRIWGKLANWIEGMLQCLRNFIHLTIALFRQRGGTVAFGEGGDIRKGLFSRLCIVFSTVDARRQLFYVLLTGWILFGHVMLSPSPISRLFWSDKVWSYSWRAYAPTERDAMMKAAMEKYVPANPDISVTAQNTVNWGHLAHRQVYSLFPWGIADPHKVMDLSNRTLEGFGVFLRTGYKPSAVAHDRYADYVVLDLQRPYFLADRGCEWIYGECRDKEMEKKFLDWVVYTRSIYDTVFEQDGFMILRRRGA